jgi:predicted acyltransferase
MSSTRLKSIDILRALTMLLMIFVNDLWSLTNIPAWLEHKAAYEDGMGLADVVFPAFLFIVGLSIPHAIGARLKRGTANIRYSNTFWNAPWPYWSWGCIWSTWRTLILKSCSSAVICGKSL